MYSRSLISWSDFRYMAIDDLFAAMMILLLLIPPPNVCYNFNTFFASPLLHFRWRTLNFRACSLTLFCFYTATSFHLINSVFIIIPWTSVVGCAFARATCHLSVWRAYIQLDRHMCLCLTKPLLHSAIALAVSKHSSNRPVSLSFQVKKMNKASARSAPRAEIDEYSDEDEVRSHT